MNFNEHSQGPGDGSDLSIASPASTPAPAARSANPSKKWNANCKVCVSPHSLEILAEVSNGAPASQVARRYGVSGDSIRRHLKRHVSEAALATARRKRLLGDAKGKLEEIRESESLGLLGRLTVLRGSLNAALSEGERVKDLRAVAQIARELHHNAELIARLLGELAPSGSTVVNVDNRSVSVGNSDLLQLRDLIEKALKPWPAARAALLTAMAEASRTQPQIGMAP